MDQISIPSIIFVSFPEVLLVAILGILSIGKFTYLKNRSNYVKILGFSIITAVSSYFIRRAVSTEVESLLVFLIIICLLFIFVLRLKFYESILATLLGLTIFIIVEMVCLILITAITGITLDQTYTSNDLMRIYISIPERIVQVVLIALSLKFKIKVVDMQSADIKRKEYYLQLFVYIVSIGTLIFLAILMGKTLLFDNGNLMSATNTLLLRLNIYLSLFVTVILTLAIRSTHEFYKNKNTLSNNELLQSLEYISNLIEERNLNEAKNAVSSLKHHITKK